tara:strand:+ start:13607 stop:13903 length:297 start_codon:yes stop_codon:yes gene_type:complete
MRVWVVSKETNLDLTDEQIDGWRNFLNLAMENGCLRTTLAEDFDRIIAVSYWPSQDVLDAVVNSPAYEKVGEKVMASWGEQMIPNHELTFNGRIVADS